MTTIKKNGRVTDAALILLAPDFRERTIVHCLERLREAGISVSLVGLSPRLIKGYHGMKVRPDYSLGQLPDPSGHKLIILPDGEACVSALFSDPRVHRLIEGTLHSQGLVAAMPESEVMLEQVGLITSQTASRFVWQRGIDLDEFSTQLIDYLE